MMRLQRNRGPVRTIHGLLLQVLRMVRLMLLHGHWGQHASGPHIATARDRVGCLSTPWPPAIGSEAAHVRVRVRVRGSIHVGAVERHRHRNGHRDWSRNRACVRLETRQLVAKLLELLLLHLVVNAVRNPRLLSASAAVAVNAASRVGCCSSPFSSSTCRCTFGCGAFTRLRALPPYAFYSSCLSRLRRLGLLHFSSSNSRSRIS